MNKLPWPDKVSILLAAPITFFGWIALGGMNLDGAGFTNFLSLEAVFFVPLWLFLRLIDAMTGGPDRRSRRPVVFPPRW